MTPIANMGQVKKTPAATMCQTHTKAMFSVSAPMKMPSMQFSITGAGINSFLLN